MTPDEIADAWEAIGRLVKYAGFSHGPAVCGEGAFVMIHLESMADADAVVDALALLGEAAKQEAGTVPVAGTDRTNSPH